MAMVYLESPSTDPAFNLAMEQYIFDRMDRDREYFMLWQNHNSIIVGKNQNTVEEINSNFVEEHNISVVRRLSGGGAVYHDLGNLNFTFIVNSGAAAQMDLAKFSRLVAGALNSLGIPAKACGRNDIMIDGKKFSGNAQYIKDGRIMHHGTLMFQSDLGVLSKALRVSGYKIESKGIKSVKSRVTNISEHLQRPMTLDEFKKHFTDCLFSGVKLIPHDLTEDDMNHIHTLQRQVYETWEWNYGSSPKYSIRKKRRFEQCGEVEVCLNVENGIITDFASYGDFFGVKDAEGLEASLAGTKMKLDSLKEALNGIEINQYFNGLKQDDFMDLILR